MAKKAPSTKKKKPVEQVRRLKYNGVDGRPFIVHPVPVPAADLEYFTLADLAAQFSEATGDHWEITDVVKLLTDGAPGRCNAEGQPLYQVNEPWKCEECGEQFQDWMEYHQHTENAHQQEDAPEEKPAEEGGEKA